MIKGEGGFIHRMMPPLDWDCGPIPLECYDPLLTTRDIEFRLRPIYFAEDRVRRLANSDDQLDLIDARNALEVLVEIDAQTIWFYNTVSILSGPIQDQG